MKYVAICHNPGAYYIFMICICRNSGRVFGHPSEDSFTGGASGNYSAVMSSTLVETVSINYEDFSEYFLTCGTCLCK